METLSKSANHVQQALAQKGLSFAVLELASSTRTASDAASAIGCDVAQIVKSLLFRTVATNQPVLVLASGANRVNENRIETLIGEKVVKADADYVREVTGYAIGGIPPLGHKQQIHQIFIDEELLQHDLLWAAAGTPFAVFCMPSKEIVQVTDGKVVGIR